MSLRAKQAKVTNWDEYSDWAKPRILSKGTSFVCNRDAKSVVIKDATGNVEVLIQDRIGRVWTLWESFVREIATFFTDPENSEFDACVVDCVDHPDNAKWKTVKIRPYGVDA